MGNIIKVGMADLNVIKRRKIQKISIEFEYGILYNNIV